MTPYPWQAKEAKDHGIALKRALFWEPRTGKTLATVLSLAHSKASRVLVVSPSAFAEGWASLLESETDYRVDRGFNHSTKRVMEHLRDWRPRKNPHDHRCLVVTYGELWRPGLADELYKYWQPDAVILDESHRCASPSSRQGRRARLIAWKARWVRILSGTPSPNTYADLWGQLSCLDYEQWHKAYKSFAEEWLILDKLYGRVIGIREEERMLRLVHEYASVVKREDVFGADQWVTGEIPIALPKKSRGLYTKLAKEWIAEEQGSLVRGDHTLRRLMKFRQIAAGFVRTEDGVDHELHDGKVQAVKDACNEIFQQGEKAVVFHHFTWEHSAYVSAFSKQKVFTIRGGTNPKDKLETAYKFNEWRGPCILVAQVQSAQEGLPLHEGSHSFFTSQDFSLKDDIQARDRIYKPGEVRTVSYVRAKNTIDQYIKRIVDGKRPIHEAIMQSSVEEMLGI